MEFIDKEALKVIVFQCIKTLINIQMVIIFILIK